MPFADDLSRPRSNLMLLLKGVAITGSFFNAGTMSTACSLLPAVYPSARKSRKIGTNAWVYYYDTMSATVPLTDLATILICSGVAYVERKENPNALGWKLWATAAGLMPVGWVYVWTVMLKPSNELVAISEAPDVVTDDKHPQSEKIVNQLKSWNSLMKVRAAFPWMVGGLGLWAALVQ